MLEQWRPIYGYEGYYEVSDQGRVRSLDRLIGYGNRRRRGRLLKPRVSSGRLWVSLSKYDVKHNRCVGRLVLLTFVGPAPTGTECCHNDGNLYNNALENLRWDTRSNNVLDSVRHGTHPRGGKRRPAA